MRLILLHIIILCVHGGAKAQVTNRIDVFDQTSFSNALTEGGIYNVNNNDKSIGVNRILQSEDLDWLMDVPSVFTLGTAFNTGATMILDAPSAQVSFNLNGEFGVANYRFAADEFSLFANDAATTFTSGIEYGGGTINIISENSVIGISDLGIELRSTTDNNDAPSMGDAFVSTGVGYFGEWGKYDYSNLLNVPSEFIPSAHTHTEADISDLQHFTGADITGNESAFDLFDKDASDDLQLGSTPSTAMPGDANLSLDDLSDNNTDELAEGSTNLYYTEARVSANADVSANSAKRNYPLADENKLLGIETGAQVNVQADWNASNGNALILNKPTLFDGLFSSLDFTGTTGFADLVDDNTQLTESEVDGFVANNGYLTSEVDGSTSNEIQDLSLTNNTLTITNNAGATPIDLSIYANTQTFDYVSWQVNDFTRTSALTLPIGFGDLSTDADLITMTMIDRREGVTTTSTVIPRCTDSDSPNGNSTTYDRDGNVSGNISVNCWEKTSNRVVTMNLNTGFFIPGGANQLLIIQYYPDI